MKPDMQRKNSNRAAVTTPKSPRTAPSKPTAPIVSEAPKPAILESVKPEVAVVAPKTAPTREEISKRAYEIYAGRGHVHGHEAEDWAQAERELLAERNRNN
jgi:hypothetical protein